MAKKILIVEDEKNIVDILSFNLTREGYTALEAYDGEAGLQLALEQDPDLILLDLMLPRKNGFDVCRAIRDAGRTTPIIMLTAREEETDKVLGLELGADDYITKPFSCLLYTSPQRPPHTYRCDRARAGIHRFGDGCRGRAICPRPSGARASDCRTGRPP